MFTKEYVTGANLNLKEYNLGIIKQPLVDDFMYDYNFIDFVRPYYIGINLSFDKGIRDSNRLFPTFLYTLSTNKNLYDAFNIGLTMIYETDLENIKMFENEEEGVVILINKKYNNELKPFAFISNSNFLLLCNTVLEMCSFEKPTPPKEVVGDPEAIERFNRKEREYFAKYGKDEVLFENTVREVMHMKNILYYRDIKDITVWQLRDLHTVESLRENEKKHFMLLCNGKSKDKKIKSWKKETRLKK